MNRLSLFLILSAAAFAQGGRCLCADAPAGKRVSIASEAHAMALADLDNYDEESWPFLRWVWICEPTPEEAKAVAMTMNYAINRSPNLIRPDSIAKGHLVRVDLRAMSPRLGDVDTLQGCLDTWERLRFDPSFSLNLTRDQVAAVLRSADQPIARVRDGKRFVDIPFARLAAADVVRLNGPHLDLETTHALQDATQSAVPVVESRYFMWRSLTSIQDDGAWKTIYGGLYYEFIGVQTAAQLKRAKATDEDVFFDSIGVGNLDAGLTAERVFARLASEQRGVVFRSDVTGKPRRWDLIPTLSANTKIGQSVMSITHDVKDKDVEIGQHPLLNLKRFKDAAREALFVRSNGLQGGILFDGNGALQREVPPDVAVNRIIPQPHSPRLEPFISCLQCHMTDGGDGWKPLRNDLNQLRKELDIFGDVDRKNALADSVAELAGLYTGSPDKTLRRAREDQQEATLRVVDGWGKDSNLKIVKNAATAISDLYTRHRYDLVTAEQALAECGLRVPRNVAVATLKQLTPPQVDANLMGGIFLEDVRLGMLKAGGGINRVDFDFIKPLVAARIRAALPKEVK